MSDASGRYSSQFHFGNGFWLGSSTLCLELNGTEKTGVGGIGGIGVVGVNGDDVPPYSVKFHVARMFLTLPSDIELLVSDEAKSRYICIYEIVTEQRDNRDKCLVQKKKFKGELWADREYEVFPSEARDIFKVNKFSTTKLNEIQHSV